MRTRLLWLLSSLTAAAVTALPVGVPMPVGLPMPMAQPGMRRGMGKQGDESSSPFCLYFQTR